MITWLAVGAAAQVGTEQLVTEQPGGWFPAAVTSPVPGRRGRGVALTQDAAATQGTFVVTHESLRMDVLAADLWPALLAVGLDTDDGAPIATELIPRAGRWTAVQLDTSDRCGTSGSLTLTVASMSAADPLPVYVDRVRLGGDVCPQFRDVDADGRCTQGFDLDGDGLCISAGEPLARPAVADCNDTSPGPRCLALTVENLGGRSILTAIGAQPDEQVWFFSSPRRGQSCPPALGGVCMDLATPRAAGNATADPQGVARVSVPALEAVWYQAGVMRLGLDSDLSPVAEAGGVVAQPDPITDR